MGCNTHILQREFCKILPDQALVLKMPPKMWRDSSNLLNVNWKLRNIKQKQRQLAKNCQKSEQTNPEKFEQNYSMTKIAEKMLVIAEKLLEIAEKKLMFKESEIFFKSWDFSPKAQKFTQFLTEEFADFLSTMFCLLRFLHLLKK